MAEIVLENVSKSYAGGATAVKNLSLTIADEPYCPIPGGTCIACASGNCTAAFSLFVPEIDLVPGDVVTTTATSAGGDTSEYSACETVILEPLPDALFANGFE